MEDQRLLTVRRSRWNYLLHYFFFCLIIPPIIAFFKRKMVKLKIFRDRIVLEQGILSKDLKVIFISDIRTIDIRQTIIQRIFRMGDLLIATSGTSDYETSVDGFPEPTKIKDLIMQQRSEGTPTERPRRRYKWLDNEDDDEEEEEEQQ